MSTSTPTSTTDVLIIGAGPTGIMMALELAEQGVSFRIIDQAPTRSDKSRAIAVQPRTLELLNRHGAAHDLVSRGRTLKGMAVFVDKRAPMYINMTDFLTGGTEFPSTMLVSQCETERFLDDCLAKHGYSVERPVKVRSEDIVQDENGVTVKLLHGHHPDSHDSATDSDHSTIPKTPTTTHTEVLRCAYVIGCDGAHSAVRHASPAFDFAGAAYPQDFILTDTHIRNSCLPPDRFSTCLGNGMLAVLPLSNGIFRVFASGHGVGSPPSDTSEHASGEQKDQPPTLAQFQALLDELGPKGAGTLHDPVWLARFRLHHRGVNAYRDRRLFLAGDAAHIHSPAGGQGMNTGMQDAVNLGWKLARALRSQGGGAQSAPRRFADAERLLDSYHAERWPVGQSLLNGTDRLFTFMANLNPLFLRIRNMLLPWVLPWFISSKARREGLFQYMSEFGITYRESACDIVGTATRGWKMPPVLKGGDRAPDERLRVAGKGVHGVKKKDEKALLALCVGPKFHLLLFSGPDEEKTRGTEMIAARDQVMAIMGSDVDVHFILGHGDRVPQALEGQDVYVDEQDVYVDEEDASADERDIAHSRYGFTGQAGYALVRPDGYIGHIGPLESLDELAEFLRD